MNRLCVVALAVIGSVSPALAGDGSGIAGYVEVTLHAGQGEESGRIDGVTVYDYGWDYVTPGATGRIAIPLDPQFGLQLDAWLGQRFEDIAAGDDEDPFYGAAAHLAYRLDGAMVGAMVSIGSSDDDGVYGTVALEGTTAVDQLRFTGQVGLTSGSGEDIADENLHVYAAGEIAYYLDPNLRLSASAGLAVGSFAQYPGEDGSRHIATWGARIEKKLDDTPISLFAAYEGWAWDGTYTYPDCCGDQDWDGTSHAAKVGIRVSFGDGTETLQSLDSTVPFRDFNPLDNSSNPTPLY